MKTCSISLVILLVSYFSNAQCITGGNGTESVIYTNNVTNSGNATDANLTTTAASLNVPIAFGSATLGINFSKPVNPGDTILVILGTPASLNISLFSNFSATAYSGKATSSDASVGTDLGTNGGSGVLSLLFIGGVAFQTLPVVVSSDAGGIGASSIQITGSAFISLGYTVNIYGVTVVPGPPTPINSSICKAGPATFQASKYGETATPVDVQWFASPDTTLTILQNDMNKTGLPYISSFIQNISNNKTFYVRQNTSGCSLHSPVVAVTETITPLTGLTFNASNCTGGNSTLTANVTGGTGSYTYAWSITGTAILSNATSVNPTVSGTGSGVIVLTVTDLNGGCTLTLTRAYLKNGTGGTCLTFSTTILPAVGLILGGTTINGKSILSWSTLQETNTSYFNVEASTDGVNFSSVGKISAAGNSIISSIYTFTDLTSVSSIVYYRVKLVDIDGGETYSNIFTLRLFGSSFARVYPNPVINVVNIETGEPGTYIVELFTVDGKKVKSSQFATVSGLVNLNIDRTNITSGIYLIKITNKSSLTIMYNTIIIK